MASPDLIKNTKHFVEYHLGKRVFAPFTGTDLPAWRSFVHLIECYSHGGGELAVTAMSCVIRLAQPKVWNVFVQSIPAVMDWSTVAELWPQIVQQTDLAAPIRLRFAELSATERIESAHETRLLSHGLAKHGLVTAPGAKKP